MEPSCRHSGEVPETVNHEVPAAPLKPHAELAGAVPRLGRLRVFLGAFPGVGKTYAMLAEGRRLAAEGADVVVGLVETHERSGLEDALGDLEVIRPRRIAYRGTSLAELDVEAILARAPDVVLVDELAHSNAPGSARDKRWQDVDELLQAGIDVLTTVNVVHIAALHDVVEQITGISQRELVPDELMRAAERVEFVDTDPRIVLRRLDQEDRAAGLPAPTRRGAFFDPDRLEALRSLTRAWIADRDDVSGVLTVQGPVVVAIAPGEPAEHVIRRAAELAALRRAPLVGVCVRDTSGVGGAIRASEEEIERTLAAVGGRYAEVGGTDVAWELARFVAREGASTLVIGDTSHSRGHRFLHGSIARRTLRLAGPVEIYIVPPPRERRGGRPIGTQPRRWRQVSLPPRRRALSYLLAIAAPIGLMAAISPARPEIGLGGALLCGVLVVVAVGLSGGIAPALVGTAVTVAAADFFFAAPYYSLRVGHPIDVVALVVFAACGAVIGVLIEVLAGHGRQVARSRAEVDALARLVARGLAEPSQPAAELAAELRAALDLDAVGILSRDGEGWTVVASAGGPLPDRPEAAQFSAEIGPGRMLVLAGPALSSPATPILQVFTAELLLARRRAQLAGLASNPHETRGLPQDSR